MVSPLLLAPALLLACLVDPVATPQEAAEAPPELGVGHKSVRGKKLKPFDGKWSTAAGQVISEVATLEKIDGQRCYVRRQVWPMGNPGLSMHSELVLDAGTLATVSFQQEVVGLPAGADLGGKPSFVRWLFDGASFELTSRTGGEEKVTEGELSEPMFEGSGLGLVIAALPLRKGYSARFPVAMTLGLTTELTTYTIQVRVVGKEELEGPRGKSLEAWVVDADWCEYGEKDVSFPGGVDGSGGTYFVLPKPPKGFPHVARYQNESTLIDVIVAEK